MKLVSKCQLIISGIIIAILLTPSSAKICKKIHIGTDTKTNTINDIIADGETSKFWTDDSSTPFIVTHSKKMEYFYMVDLGVDINSSNIHLSYDNHQYANSTVSVKEETNKKHWYTLEVLYNCEAYGGALVTYKIQVAIPDCGSAEFVWKKVCGYPLTPRDGFTIDILYGQTKLNIVKNGLPVNENFWDPEVNDWAINVPKDINSAKFEIYMNSDDLKAKQQSNPPMDTIVNTTTNTATNTTLPGSALASIPETTVGAPKVDSDDAVARVTIDGPLVGKGGTVKQDKVPLNINFTCEKVKDYSTVEFVIPMTNFRDINIYFYKECDNAPPKGRGIPFWILVLVLTFIAYKIFVNVYRGRKGFEIIPFISGIKSISGWLLKTASNTIQKFSKSSQNHNNMEDVNSSKERRQNDDDEENEFNIKNISELKHTDNESDEHKYGTI